MKTITLYRYCVTNAWVSTFQPKQNAIRFILWQSWAIPLLGIAIFRRIQCGFSLSYFLQRSIKAERCAEENLFWIRRKIAFNPISRFFCVLHSKSSTGQNNTQKVRKKSSKKAGNSRHFTQQAGNRLEQSSPQTHLAATQLKQSPLTVVTRAPAHKHTHRKRWSP